MGRNALPDGVSRGSLEFFAQKSQKLLYSFTSLFFFEKKHPKTRIKSPKSLCNKHLYLFKPLSKTLKKVCLSPHKRNAVLSKTTNEHVKAMQ
jgi:hypothetical protein